MPAHAAAGRARSRDWRRAPASRSRPRGRRRQCALARSAAPPDLAAEGFAQLFARRYLTWEANDPEAHARALAPFVGAGMEPDAGLQPPSGGEQQVQWTEVVQERTAAPGEHVYTVAAQTDTAGLVYLTVSVARAGAGALQLAGYPAFVGAPASGPADAPSAGCAKSRTRRCRRSWNARCATTWPTPAPSWRRT